MIGFNLIFLDVNSGVRFIVTRNTKYSMAFTTGGLLQQESIILAECYLAHRDWKLVRQQVLAENLLQSRTESSLKKITGEIIKRLKLLNDDELEYLVNANSEQQTWILWVAICKYYSFIRDFAMEVIREKFLSLYLDVTHDDYDNFFNRKADWHDELDKLSEQSRSKLRQVLFKMLVDVGILSKQHQIQPVLLSESFIKTISRASGDYLISFPVSDNQIREHLS